MTKLIINADDFGLSEAVNYGIISAHKTGVVTSTSTMANMPGFEHAMELPMFRWKRNHQRRIKFISYCFILRVC